MSRKVYIEIKTRLVINMDEGVEVSEVMENISFNSTDDRADVEDTEIIDWEVTDSK